MHSDIPAEEQATAVGEAIACLSSLTRLQLESPTRALVAAVTPHLPALSLRNLLLDMRAEGYTGMSKFEPYVGEFACNAVHLRHLTSLSLRAFNVSPSDVSALTEVLRNNTGLESVLLALIGNRKQLAVHVKPQAGPSHGAIAENTVLVELCSALRALPLDTLALEFDAWMQDTERLLFQPAGQGLSPDPCWSQLTSCICCVLTPWPHPQLVPGDAVFRPLCGAEQLQYLQLNKCHITEDTFKVRSVLLPSSACGMP